MQIPFKRLIQWVGSRTAGCIRVVTRNDFEEVSENSGLVTAKARPGKPQKIDGQYPELKIIMVDGKG